MGSSGTTRSPECPALRGGERGTGGGRAGDEHRAGAAWVHLAEPRTSGAHGPRRAAQSAGQADHSSSGVCRELSAFRSLVGSLQTFRSWEDRWGSNGSREPWGPGGCPELSCWGSPRSVTALRAVAGVSACVFVGKLAVVN